MKRKKAKKEWGRAFEENSLMKTQKGAVLEYQINIKEKDNGERSVEQNCSFLSLLRSAVVLGLFGPELLQEKYEVSYANQSIIQFVSYQQSINELEGFQPINP
jgi:hypothetical protein